MILAGRLNNTKTFRNNLVKFKVPKLGVTPEAVFHVAMSSHVELLYAHVFTLCLYIFQGSQGNIVHSCGVTPPPEFISVGQTVQINYAATSGASTGFSLSYRTACKLIHSVLSSKGWNFIVCVVI